MRNHCDGYPSALTRRQLLAGAAASAALSFAPAARSTESRTLAFYHTHTGERLRLTYAEAGAPIPAALQEIDRFLRDFRTGDVHAIDPRLLDVLYQLLARAGSSRGTFEIISAYRSPRTNETLRSKSSGVAEHSLHMEGKAIDVRLTGVRTSRLREAALSLRAGGVGYYPASNFVHIDTGRVRQW
jgi:uncharacterized protein YcbK (DUF882 family)